MLLILGGLLSGLGFGAGAVLKWVLPVAPLNLGGAAPGEPLNILVIGVDPTPVPGDVNDKTVRHLADTVLVLNMDYRNHRGFVLAIPRDTRATLGEAGEGAVGDALALGGVQLLQETVEELTGLSINHSIWMDLDGARDLVKDAGGLTAYLPKAVKYADKTTGLSLDLAQGWHDLTPEQTLAYAYYRVPGGDLDRLDREQMLIGRWQAKIHGGWGSFWFPSAAGRAVSAVTTDLPKADFQALAGEWRKIEPRDIGYALLPGEVSAKGEWLMSPERWDGLLPRLQSVPSQRPLADLKPTLEILYGDPHGGDKVMSLADTLTKQGFQVQRTAVQADWPGAESVLVDRAKAEERSAAVLEALDKAVDGVRVVLDPGDVTGYGARYTLRLGQGFFRK